jgi:RNA polymerase sigma factor for flagellar operon FliA
MTTTKIEEEVEARVRDIAPLVRRIARQLSAKLPQSVELDDVIQSGMMGLLEAARRYEACEEVPFEAYAAQRIRGAMLDGLRQCDWLPRGVRRSLRQVEAMISRLEQQHGRAPTEAELASAMDMPLAEYQRLLQDARGYQIVSYEDFGAVEDDSFLDRYAVDHEADPLHVLEDRGWREALVEGIDELPEREKLVMGLYYEQELNLREIGEVLKVTESRVCQIHTQAIARLRAALRDAG